jgi:hypothetical protein
MKVFTFYSDTHENMLKEWFLKTLPDDVEVVIKRIPQDCPTGEFDSGEGWDKAMLNKHEYIIECCENETEIFIHADCDIQFFKPFKDEILQIMEDQDLDILAQQDIPGPICCGFMAIRPGVKSATFFKECLKNMRPQGSLNDQNAVNHVLNNGYDIKLGLLDERYYSVWRDLNTVWDGTQKLSPPKDIVMHHANFVVGVNLKVDCMKVVREHTKALEGA